MGLMDKAKSAAQAATEKAKEVQEHRKEAAEEKAAAIAEGQETGEQPLTELKGSHMKTKEFRPNRVLVFNNRVEERDPGLLKERTQTIHFTQVAQVSVKRGVVWSEVKVESTGGHEIVAKGLSKDEADAAKKLLDQLIHESRTQPVVVAAAPPAAPDIPEQIRKLGELRDAGILSNEEFEAKKAELLSRM
jgi:hypothetical protein